MKARLHFLAWSLLGLALAVAGIRLAMSVSSQEVGWETIAATWRGAALGWTGWSPTTISEREPPEQAEFWLREVDRVLSQQPESAELCMGAAWVLDSPGVGYLTNYLGPYLAVAFGLALITVWYVRFHARKADQPTWRYWSCLDRPRWAGLFRCLAKSATAAGLCALLVYLWLAPAGLQVAEDLFQYRMGYCRNPASQIARIEEADEEIFASEAEMKAIRDQVDVHFEQAREEVEAPKREAN